MTTTSYSEVAEGRDAWGSRPTPPDEVCGCVPHRAASDGSIGLRTISLLGAHGGAGTSTVAAILALTARTIVPTHLLTDQVDHLCALMGVEPRADSKPVMGGLTVGPRVEPCAQLEIRDDGAIAFDLERSVQPDGCRLIVLRGPCYLALRQLARIDVGAIDGIILLEEPGRSLTHRDVADVTGVPVIATVAVTASIARAIDAGTLRTRLNAREFRPLRRWLCDHFDPFPNRIARDSADAPNKPQMADTDLLGALSALLADDDVAALRSMDHGCENRGGLRRVGLQPSNGQAGPWALQRVGGVVASARRLPGRSGL